MFLELPLQASDMYLSQFGFSLNCS